MTIVLLSLKPEFAARILSGEKRFEFRRTRFRCRVVTAALMYSNSTQRRIVGAFEIGGIHEASPKRLWTRYRSVAGINECAFFEYFEGLDRGYAIEISRVLRFVPAIDPKTAFPGFVPPQSFRYLSARQASQLLPSGLSVADIDQSLVTRGLSDEPKLEDSRPTCSSLGQSDVRVLMLCR